MTAEMSPRPDGDPPAMRASHQDRDRVVDILQTAAGDGRLTADELDERLEKALTARTYAELEALTTDLPVAGGRAVPVPAGDVTPKDLVRIETRSGSVSRTGRWVVPHRLVVAARSGTVTLNLTEAVIAVPTLEIAAEVRSGTLTLVTRPGIVVDAEEVSVRSGAVSSKVPWGSEVPQILRVVVTGQIRSGAILIRPPRRPRRTFWQWLRRAPRPPYPLTGP